MGPPALERGATGSRCSMGGRSWLSCGLFVLGLWCINFSWVQPLECSPAILPSGVSEILSSRQHGFTITSKSEWLQFCSLLGEQESGSYEVGFYGASRETQTFEFLRSWVARSSYWAGICSYLQVCLLVSALWIPDIDLDLIAGVPVS